MLATLDYSFQQLPDADFRDKDLRGASFRYAYLHKADFRGANLEGADFWGADLREARFDAAVWSTPKYSPQTERSCFFHAELTDTVFDPLRFIHAHVNSKIQQLNLFESHEICNPSIPVCSVFVVSGTSGSQSPISPDFGEHQTGSGQ